MIRTYIVSIMDVHSCNVRQHYEQAFSAEDALTQVRLWLDKRNESIYRIAPAPTAEQS